MTLYDRPLLLFLRRLTQPHHLFTLRLVQYCAVISATPELFFYDAVDLDAAEPTPAHGSAPVL